MKSKMIVACLVAALLLLTTFLPVGIVGAEEAEEIEEKEVKIGVMQALTGDLGIFGGPMTDAMKLVMKEVNENGGLLNGTLTLIIEDTGTSEVLAVDGANKLVKVDKVPAIVGTTSSGPSMAIIGITTANNVLQISSSNTAPDFTIYEDNDFYFRTAPSDALQGKAMARLAIAEGFKTTGTLVVNNPYGVGFEGVFAEEFKALGGTVLESVRYDPQGTIFDSEIEKVCKQEPDFVMLCSYPETGSIILKAAYEKGHMENIGWLLSEGLRDEALAELVGKDENGNYLIAGLKGTTPDPRAAGPAYEEFKEKYVAEYGTEVTTYCSNSYDATVVVALAIEKAGNATGTAIRDSIRDVSNAPGENVTDVGEALKLIREGKEINYQGASGEITFDKNGDVLGSYCEWSISNNGSIALLEPIDLTGPVEIPEEEEEVEEEQTATQTQAPTPEGTPSTATTTEPEKEEDTPGFEAVFAITGILAVSYLLTRRRNRPPN